MKNLILSATILFATVTFISCEKTCMSKNESEKDEMNSELASEGQQINVNGSNYERSVTEALQASNDDSPFSSGVIEYKENGELVASIDFGKGGLGKATCKNNGQEKVIETSKKGKKYKKVIIEPLVKSNDCKYIVSGIIKFYDVKNGSWLATFDYGNGTCDDIISKTTAKGTSSFSMTKYPEWN